MRRLVDLLPVVLLSSLSVSVLAHAGPEELGHHWQVAKYTTELRLQTVVMLAFIVGVVAVVTAKKVMGKRKKRI